MRFLIAIAIVVGVAACTPDTGVRTAVAEFEGSSLKVIWSPGSDNKATVIKDDPVRDILPVTRINSLEFQQFFETVTGCMVDRSEPISTTSNSSGPFSIVVPKRCASA